MNHKSTRKNSNATNTKTKQKTVKTKDYNQGVKDGYELAKRVVCTSCKAYLNRTGTKA